jgi:glycosyltransferase involved in cell wall biosynthesis
MKLSIVIPAHNEEACIGPCLKAVLNEVACCGHTAEVLVVNNASTDCTGPIASRFPGVRVVNEPCKGLSRARNRGYLESSGELIANIDADCLMPRGYLTRVVRHFERNHRLALLSGPFFYYDLPQTARIVTQILYMFQYFPNILGQRVLKMGALAQGGNFAVRRTMMDKVGGFNTSLTFWGEDADAAIRLSRVGLVAWSMRLTMKTSARRLLKEGVLRAGAVYTVNNILMIFRGRPLSRSQRDIRGSALPAGPAQRCR